VFDSSVTDPLNFCSVPVGTMVLVGATVMTTMGTMVTLTDADWEGSATLVAVTMTIPGEGANDGAE
jgi:hypothetical protein